MEIINNDTSEIFEFFGNKNINAGQFTILVWLFCYHYNIPVIYRGSTL